VKRKLLLSIINFAYKILARPEFLGTENIPAHGGIILATNHMSFVDVPMLMLTPGRPEITALAGDSYKKHILFKVLLNWAEVIWIDREKADFPALSAARHQVQNGGALVIAPEGTRSKVGHLLEGKAGTALLAARAGCPIIPVGITGTEVAFKKLLSFHRPKLIVRFGRVFTLPPFVQEDRSRWLARCTDEIMCQIAALLPEKYRGFYKNHPRLKELLRNSSNQ